MRHRIDLHVKYARQANHRALAYARAGLVDAAHTARMHRNQLIRDARNILRGVA